MLEERRGCGRDLRERLERRHQKHAVNKHSDCRRVALWSQFHQEQSTYTVCIQLVCVVTFAERLQSRRPLRHADQDLR